MSQPTFGMLPSHPLPEPDTALATNARESIQALIDSVGSGHVSRRKAARIAESIEPVRVFGAHVAQIVEQGCQIARASATSARDVERLAAEIASFRAIRDGHTLESFGIGEQKKHLPGIIEEESKVRTVAAQVAWEELAERRDVLLRQREADKERIADERAARRAQLAHVQATRTARADAARKKNDEAAARITQDVQLGSVPLGANQPFHAFAACVYLAAKLDDGLSSDEAATRTREAVLARMTAGAPSHEEIEAYRSAYQELKQRATAAAHRQDASEIFAAAENLTGGVQ
jgi:hypothetical protein